MARCEAGEQCLETMFANLVTHAKGRKVVIDFYD